MGQIRLYGKARDELVDTREGFDNLTS